AICAAAVMWGIDGVVLRPRLYSLDVPVIVFTEHILAALLLLPFFRHRLEELKSLNSRDWFSFLWVSLFGGAIGTMAIVGAILYSFKAGTNIAVVLILQKLQPVFAIILSMLVLREVPKKTFFAWGVLALVGSYLLSFGASPPSIDGDVLIPIVLALLAAFSFGSSTVFGKFAVRKVSFETATLTRFLLTAGIMFVVLLLS
ncbi:MAG: EamA family transporter, partial [bacterium]|nr:EamA family transporter [bacterium]